MKRLALYILILSGLAYAPVERADVGKLAPVEAVLLDSDGTSVMLSTDMGEYGKGGSVDEALENMKECSKAYVYLDTARYLLVTDSATHHIKDITKHLKQSVKVCIAPFDTDLKAAAKYLRTHSGQPTLRQWKKGAAVPAEEALKNFKKSQNNA